MSRLVKTNLILFICMILMTFGGLLLFFLPPKIAQGVPQFIFILLPAIVYLRLNNKNIKETLRLNPLKLKDILIIILLPLAMRPFLGIVSAIGSNLFGDQITEMISETSKNFSFSFLLFSIAITPAICEEVIMRGVVLDGYRSLGMKKAIILNGILFGMFHMNFHQFSYTFFMGMALAAAVYFTNSLFAGMLIHFINNGIDTLLLYAVTKGLIKIDKAAEVTKAGASSISSIQMLQTGIVAMISIVLTYLLFKALKKSNSEKIQFVEREDTQSREISGKIVNWSFILVFIIFFGISLLLMLADKLM